MISARKIVRVCRELSRMTEEPGGTTRTFLSPPMHKVHSYLSSWMADFGIKTHVDAAGNLRGLYGDPSKPRLIIGSHLDTVPHAGAFDGVLGVVLGIGIAARQPRLAIEIVGFSEEEGVRFGKPFLGSRALIGDTEWGDSAILQAISDFGLDPAQLPAARFSPDTIAYLEIHIEQGPVLERLGLRLGVVDTISGQSRFMVKFQGAANHAGTTPMAARADALVAAARWIVEVERYGASTPGLVATVGSLRVWPNAVNVIPGEVQASLDVRHADDDQRRAAARHLLSLAKTEHKVLLSQKSVRMDRALTETLGCAVQAGGFPIHRMASGAGHDAMIVAPQIPSAMLFVRSPGGISHHPAESVHESDVGAAMETGLDFANRLARQHA